MSAADGKPCRSQLTLAGKNERCVQHLGHVGMHAWWSADGRIEVTWQRGAGGASWRRPLLEPAAEKKAS